MNTPDGRKFFEDALAKLHARLVLYAQTIVHNAPDAQDIVQEVYLKILDIAADRFDGEKALAAYLFRSVRNTALNRIGRKDPLRHAVELLNAQVADEVAADTREGELAVLRRRIEALPRQSRRIVTEVFVHGKKYREVAARLSISENTVKTTLRRAMAALRVRS